MSDRHRSDSSSGASDVSLSILDEMSDNDDQDRSRSFEQTSSNTSRIAMRDDRPRRLLPNELTTAQNLARQSIPSPPTTARDGSSDQVLRDEYTATARPYPHRSRLSSDSARQRTEQTVRPRSSLARSPDSIANNNNNHVQHTRALSTLEQSFNTEGHNPHRNISDHTISNANESRMRQAQSTSPHQRKTSAGLSASQIRAIGSTVRNRLYSEAVGPSRPSSMQRVVSGTSSSDASYAMYDTALSRSPSPLPAVSPSDSRQQQSSARGTGQLAQAASKDTQLSARATLHSNDSSFDTSYREQSFSARRPVRNDSPMQMSPPRANLSRPRSMRLSKLRPIDQSDETGLSDKVASMRVRSSLSMGLLPRSPSRSSVRSIRQPEDAYGNHIAHDVSYGSTSMRSPRRPQSVVPGLSGPIANDGGSSKHGRNTPNSSTHLHGNASDVFGASPIRRTESLRVRHRPLTAQSLRELDVGSDDWWQSLNTIRSSTSATRQRYSGSFAEVAMSNTTLKKSPTKIHAEADGSHRSPAMISSRSSRSLRAMRPSTSMPEFGGSQSGQQGPASSAHRPSSRLRALYNAPDTLNARNSPSPSRALDRGNVSRDQMLQQACSFYIKSGGDLRIAQEVARRALDIGDHLQGMQERLHAWRVQEASESDDNRYRNPPASASLAHLLQEVEDNARNASLSQSQLVRALTEMLLDGAEMSPAQS